MCAFIAGILPLTCMGRKYDRARKGISDLSLEVIPSDTDFAAYVRNDIQLIPRGVFVNLPVLERISLVTNDVSEIEDNAFSEVPTVEVLLLSENELEIIKTGQQTLYIYLMHLLQRYIYM